MKKQPFYHKYGPKSLFEFIRMDLKKQENPKTRRSVIWTKSGMVKKCKIPMEISTKIRQTKTYSTNWKICFATVNINTGRLKSFVLSCKHMRVTYYVELENFHVKYIGNEAPYSLIDCLMDGDLFEKSERIYLELQGKAPESSTVIIREESQNSEGTKYDHLLKATEETSGEDILFTPTMTTENVVSKRKIKGIQFEKKLLMGVTLEKTDQFCKTMMQKLEYIERFVSGETTAAGKTLRFVRLRNGTRTLKYRLGKRRFSMLFNNGILTCIGISTHDRQMQDIENFKVKQAGMVYYEIDEFMERIKSYEAGNKVPLSKFLMMPRHYVLSQDQKEILNNKEGSLNISIVGNAGAGKSLVGMKWVANESSKENNRCLYLTMSKNLVYALKEQFETELAEDAKSDCCVSSIGDFIHGRMKLAYSQLPDKSFLDTKASFEVFKNFWLKKVSKDPRQIMEYWRSIHGYLKGALPHELDLKGKLKIPEYIDEDEYVRLREMAGEKNYLSWDECMKVYKKYQAYLGFAHLYDDNDLAKMLITTNKWRKGGYSSVFLDECQDLTQVQLMAILCQLRGARSKVFSSDRCQMVQPVWFKEGYLRTLANELDRAWGKKLDAKGIRAHYLHYNFRSTRRIIQFQNEIVSFFRENTILSLKQIEMLEIEAPFLAREGIKPIWVRCSIANKEHLTLGIWHKMTVLDLQPIIANRNLPTLEMFGTAGRLAADVVECKGMEYPSVLMFNVMDDVKQDAAMAWKYFYVAATRSSDVLIIYDEITETEGKIREFFLKAAARGVVDECKDIQASKDDYDGTWLEYIEEQVLRPQTEEERLATAGNAMDYDQYRLALEIYRQIVPDEDITIYCQGKVHEQDKEYRKAIMSYAKIFKDWMDRGRNRKNSVEELLKAPDIEKVDYLAAMILSSHERTDFMENARQGYVEKYGVEKDFNDRLWEAVAQYSFAPEMMCDWMDIAYRTITGNLEKLSEMINEVREVRFVG